MEFLQLTVTKWITDFESVNDLAKGGNRLAHDFKNSVHNEKHYQNVLQTVEFCRNHVQKLRWKKGYGIAVVTI